MIDHYYYGGGGSRSVVVVLYSTVAVHTFKSSASCVSLHFTSLLLVQPDSSASLFAPLRAGARLLILHFTAASVPARSDSRNLAVQKSPGRRCSPTLPLSPLR